MCHSPRPVSLRLHLPGFDIHGPRVGGCHGWISLLLLLLFISFYLFFSHVLCVLCFDFSHEKVREMNCKVGTVKRQPMVPCFSLILTLT
jgi:hypothetical protein